MSASTWPPEPAGAATGPTRAPGSARAAGPIEAAVLVPLLLLERSPEPVVVLTRRRADLRRHAGEISFPGGRRDAGDADLSVTALREAEEEIGLSRADVRLLGTLPRTSTFATNYVIHPFVGTVTGAVDWRPSADEVDAVLELPLETLRAARTRTSLERRGIRFETDAYIVEEHLIWGATARIIEDLLERLRADGPGDSPSLAERG